MLKSDRTCPLKSTFCYTQVTTTMVLGEHGGDYSCKPPGAFKQKKWDNRICWRYNVDFLIITWHHDSFEGRHLVGILPTGLPELSKPMFQRSNCRKMIALKVTKIKTDISGNISISLLFAIRPYQALSHPFTGPIKRKCLLLDPVMQRIAKHSKTNQKQNKSIAKHNKALQNIVATHSKSVPKSQQSITKHNKTHQNIAKHLGSPGALLEMVWRVTRCSV